jgi:hypothetical protein
MAAMNTVSTGGFWGEFSFKKMSAGGRLCTLQENPHFWVPTIKVKPPGGNWNRPVRNGALVLLLQSAIDAHVVRKQRSARASLLVSGR